MNLLSDIHSRLIRFLYCPLSQLTTFQGFYRVQRAKLKAHHSPVMNTDANKTFAKISNE